MTETRKRRSGRYVRASVRREHQRAKHWRTFQDVAEGHALAALEALASLAESAASESVRVSAANAVLDRAYGKPTPGGRWAAGEEEQEAVEPGRLKVRWLPPS
jgi:hypothetical protein